MNQNQNQNEFQVYHGGKGIFYGVIAVATLVVAIIGATFAYFTATAQSSENALAAQAAHVQVDYTEGEYIKATNLIPASAKVVQLAYAQPRAEQYNETNAEAIENNTLTSKNEGDVGTKCVDENGYFVCAIYEFSVTNSSNVKQQLSAYMKINVNSFITTDAEKMEGGEGTGIALNIGETGAGNRALKVMVVRSETEIDVNAFADDPENDSDNCNWDASITTESTKFCSYDEDSEGAKTYRDDTHFDPYEYLETATQKTYYYFNTTAARQSIKEVGETQDLFIGDVIPAISEANLDPTTGQVIWLNAAGEELPSNADPSLRAKAKGAQTRTYYVVVWLEETGTDQDADQDAQFMATINVQSTGSGEAGGNVTGTLD